MRALGFRHTALFWNQNASKTTVVENQGETSNLFSSVKVRKGMCEIPHSLYNQRRGTKLSFKSTAGQHTRARTTIEQLYRKTSDINSAQSDSDFLTLQTLVRKLENLGSITAAGLLNFRVRCWWVEATSEWRLVKHPADGIDLIDQRRFRLATYM